jgi:hypothetical protein
MSRTNWPIVKREQLWAELDNPTRSALPWHFWRLQTASYVLDPLSCRTEAGLPLTGTLVGARGSSTIESWVHQEHSVSVTPRSGVQISTDLSDSGYARASGRSNVSV